MCHQKVTFFFPGIKRRKTGREKTSRVSLEYFELIINRGEKEKKKTSLPRHLSVASEQGHSPPPRGWLNTLSNDGCSEFWLTTGRVRDIFFPLGVVTIGRRGKMLEVVCRWRSYQEKHIDSREMRRWALTYPYPRTPRNVLPGVSYPNPDVRFTSSPVVRKSEVLPADIILRGDVSFSLSFLIYIHIYIYI